MCVSIQFKVRKGSQNTTQDIFIAQWLTKKQLHVSALVMAIIRLCNTYCKITIQYAKQQYGLITRSQSPLQIYRSNLVYVIMYLVGKVQAVEGVRSTSHTYDYVCAVLHMRICNYIHYYIYQITYIYICNGD